jgi:predicted dehydrogenase
MGHGDMLECLRQGNGASTPADVVAVCDLDRERVDHARRVVLGFYADQETTRTRPDVQTFQDYRQLLARDDIDGVTISTPDHWHALIAVAAARAGKDIYLQKPLTYTIVEGQALVRSVRQHQVILQTGSQQRSSSEFRRACQLVRDGALGPLRSIRVTLPTDSGQGDPTPEPVPDNLDYATWLGPAPLAEYCQDRVHPQAGFGRPGWLQIEAYSRGMITGWGSHMFDIAQWGHGSDHGGPVEMTASGQFPDRGLFDVHTDFQATGRYADGVELIAVSGSPAGVRFEGEDGWIDVGRGRLVAQPAGLLTRAPARSDDPLAVSRNHMRDFLQSMRTRQDPICPVEVGHRSNSICVITHLAMKLGRTLRWDPESESFLDDGQANALLDYPHRSPWRLD